MDWPDWPNGTIVSPKRKVHQSGFKAFNTVARSIQNHYETILNRGGNPLL